MLVHPFIVLNLNLALTPRKLTCLSFNPNNNTSSITVNLGILSLSPPIDPFS